MRGGGTEGCPTPWLARRAHGSVPSAFDTSQSGGFYSAVTVQTPSKGCPFPEQMSLDRRTPPSPHREGFGDTHLASEAILAKASYCQTRRSNHHLLHTPNIIFLRMNLAFRKQRNASSQVPEATSEASRRSLTAGWQRAGGKGLSYTSASQNSSWNPPATHPTSSVHARPSS